MSAQGPRAAILGAAVELGSLRGLEELSMGGLASAVAMSKSGLFAHFGSKRELQLATLAQAWEVFEAEVLRLPGDDAPPDLDALLERWLSFYERKVFPGGCFFLVSAVQFAGRQDPVAEALAAAVDRQTSALEEAVHRAGESGEMPARKDPGRTALGLYSLLVNADSLYHVGADPVVFERARVSISELLGQPDGLRKTSRARRRRFPAPPR